MMPSIKRSAETSCAERGNGRTSTGTGSAGSCTQDLRDRRLLLADRRGNPVSVRLHDLVEPCCDVLRLTAFHRDAFVLHDPTLLRTSPDPPTGTASRHCLACTRLWTAGFFTLESGRIRQYRVIFDTAQLQA